MMKQLRWYLVVGLFLAGLPFPVEGSVFSDALGKARAMMQSAFQLSFLPKLPVIFYKDHFNTMFTHAQQSIDQIKARVGDRTITRENVQNDKALHIKKSAELALHIQSLIGSAHLAYGITMAVGLIKEAIDGSFLNPNGSRSKEDLFADHVGARAVFGKEKFDASLGKYLEHFVDGEVPKTASASAGSVQETPGPDGGSVSGQRNPFNEEPVTVTAP
jgi:hypothetical protein